MVLYSLTDTGAALIDRVLETLGTLDSAGVAG